MMNYLKLITIGYNIFIKLQYILLIAILDITRVVSTMNANSNTQTEHIMTFPDQQTVLGSSVALPCDITAPGVAASDSVTLILWYRGDDISGAPIYSIDARSRNTPLESAKHFIGDDYEGRANFDISVRPALLRLGPIVDTDNGQYWCRVDFRWTRTTISSVALTVIVPPKRVIIRDENGIELKTMANFDEGSDVRLFCESIGGNPLPTITWFRNNRKLKTQTVMIRDNSTVVSGVTLERIARGDINSVVKCHAGNSEQTRAVTKSITIDINLRPLKAHIIAINKDRLTAGRKLEAICHTFGSRPPAVINWFISDRQLTIESKEISMDINGTKSIVTFIPTPEDNGLDLKCRAENPKLSNSAIEDHINLDVKFMPNVSLTMGSTTGFASVNESNEILLECNVSSNPKPTRIRWMFNRKELVQDVVKGIIIANSTLVVKKARQESEGRYQCVAYNGEGRGDSPELFVQVFFAPKCVSQQRVIETSIAYPTNIFCEVDANPENVTFHWHSSNIDDLRRVTISSKSLRSKLTIIPQMSTDFGTYTCWAQNLIGSNQLTPCVFNVTDSGLSWPRPVTDCSVNATYGSIYIKCNYFETKLNQLFTKDTEFHLEVRDSQNSRVIVNQTNSFEPVFNVTDMEWAPIYQIIVYVSNALGVSDEVTMMVQPELPALKSSAKASPISPNSQQQQTNDSNSSHKILMILVSLLTVVLIILSILIMTTIVLCFLRQKNQRKREKLCEQQCGAGGSGDEGAASELSVQPMVSKRKNRRCNKKLSQTNAKASDDSIATSDASAHPDLIPSDGLVFYSNDHNMIIDDHNSTYDENGFDANNSLSMYRDIIIAANVATGEHARPHIVSKSLLTNHTNHVSVINVAHHQSAQNADNVLLVQSHHSQQQPMDTFVAKYQAIDGTGADIETTANYLHLSSSYPQTTPV